MYIIFNNHGIRAISNTHLPFALTLDPIIRLLRLCCCVLLPALSPSSYLHTRTLVIEVKELKGLCLTVSPGKAYRQTVPVVGLTLTSAHAPDETPAWTRTRR